MRQKQLIEIDSAHFHEIADAKDRLIEAILLEEKMQYLLANYKEYESYLLNSALNDLIGESKSYHEFQRERGEINRRVVNFLASARAYLDHGGHHLKKILRLDTVPEFFPRVKSEHYDDSLAYRIMEALRNYTQHRGFPIHMVSFKRSRAGKGEFEMGVEYTVTPRMRIAEFTQDRKFKRSVAEELKDLDENLALTPLLREYVERLSSMHSVVQQETNQQISSARESIASALDRVKSEFGFKAVKPGILVIAWTEDGGNMEGGEFSLIPEFDERYQSLRDSNKPIRNLLRRYVTSKAEK